MQQTRTHKAVTWRIEAKMSYSLVEGNQTIINQFSAKCDIPDTTLIKKTKTVVHAQFPIHFVWLHHINV